MRSRVLFTGGTVVTTEGMNSVNVLIEGEIIRAVEPGLDVPADRTVDCTGKLLFPGIIDPHTHMGIPIKDIWSADDFNSGSRAALQGGVTTIIDFTVLEPNQSLKASFHTRRDLARVSLVDVALHVNLTRFSEDLLNEIPDLVADGAVSFKVFTTYREAGMMLDYDQIRTAAERIARAGGVLMVHAEDDAILQKALIPLLNRKYTHPRYHGQSRPDAAEAEAIRRVANIGIQTNCPVYVVHLSSARGLAAAQEGNVLVETCPQYLLLDDRCYDREDGAMFVASPPLRKPADSEALWQGITDGTIHALGTDHCPFCRKDKPAGLPFQDIPNGMGGVDTLFPVLLTQFLDRGLSLPRLASLLSRNPAEIFGLYPQKGAITPGSDADLVIVDPKKRSTDWMDQRLSRTDWTAYADFPAIFPDQVWRRGELMYMKGALVGKSNGRFIPGHRPQWDVINSRLK